MICLRYVRALKRISNTVLHGGGSGVARVWREPGAVLFESRDRGRVEGPLVGRVRPTASQIGGRGLWIANQLCDLVQIRSGTEAPTCAFR